MARASPTSLCVIAEQMRRGAALDLAACYAMEFRLVRRFMAGADFYEGVRAVLTDKDPAGARWTPARLEGVRDEDVRAYFAPLPAAEEWAPPPLA